MSFFRDQQLTIGRPVTGGIFPFYYHYATYTLQVAILEFGNYRPGKPHADVTECCVLVNSLENEADRITNDAISYLFEAEKDTLP
jgi:hypothetical protein